jgi:hypothetical protein
MASSNLKMALGDVKNKSDEAKQRRKLKDKRKREEEEAKAEGREVVKKVPRTIENTRKADETTVQVDDDEVAGDEAIDEFAQYYANKQKPKMLITTSNRPKSGVCDLSLFPLGIDVFLWAGVFVCPFRSWKCIRSCRSCWASFRTRSITVAKVSPSKIYAPRRFATSSPI